MANAMATTNENTIAKVTALNLTNMPEGLRLTYTYSRLNQKGDFVERNGTGSFVILDDMTVLVPEKGAGDMKEVCAADVIKALFALAVERVE